MEGTKIDLDGVREGQSFGKAKMVIEDLDLEEALHPTLSTPPVPEDVGDIAPTPSAEPVKSDTKAIAEAIKSAVRSSRARSSQKSSAAKSSVRRMASPRDINDIFPVERVEQETRSPPKSADKIEPGIQVPEPTMSEGGQLEKQAHEEEFEEVDMMPRTDDEKHLYWKTRLQILKTRFRDVTIPKNVADMEWRSLRKIYYIEMDRVSIAKNVEGYKMIMIVMFFILEYIGAKFLKINITGFTVHSLRTMHRYERLLIELGEKDYASFGANWPVELRLAGLVGVNAVIFVIAKYVFKVTGSDTSDEFFELFQSMGNANVEADIPNAGMDAPDPKGGNNGMMGMLSGLLNSFTGGAGGGGGGLNNLFSAFAGGGGGGGTGESGGDGDKPAGPRVGQPTYRRKKKKKQPPKEEV